MSTLSFGRVAVIGAVVSLAAWVAPSGAQEAAGNKPARSQEEKRVVTEYFAPPAPAAGNGESPESPKARISRLERENAALRGRVKELEAQVDQLKRRRTATVLPQPAAGGAVPPEWKRVPFNSGFYYVVPLEKTAGDSKPIETPARPAPQPK
jgi:hypothetical protein